MQNPMPYVSPKPYVNPEPESRSPESNSSDRPKRNPERESKGASAERKPEVPQGLFQGGYYESSTRVAVSCNWLAKLQSSRVAAVFTGRWQSN